MNSDEKQCSLKVKNLIQVFKICTIYIIIIYPTYNNYVPPGWPAGHYVSGLSSVLPSFRPSRFRGTTLRAAPSKSYAFSTNDHAYIAMPTWPRCAPPILCWPWLPYNLLLRSCLTWDFFRRSSLMGTTLRAAPSKSYTFSTNDHACIAMTSI